MTAVAKQVDMEWIVICPGCDARQCVSTHGYYEGWSRFRCLECDGSFDCTWRNGPTSQAPKATPPYTAALNAFVNDARKRLEEGEKVYGDLNMKRATSKVLVKELREELLDVANYSFMLSLRVDAILSAMGGDDDAEG